MNRYDELRKRQQEEHNQIDYLGFAFSDEQFEDVLEKWGIRKSDTKALKNIVSLGCGAYIQKKDIERYKALLKRHREELQAAIDGDSTGEGFVCEMFYSELVNHEYGYTGDPDDALGALGLTVEQVVGTPKLNKGFTKAHLEIFAEEE